MPARTGNSGHACQGHHRGQPQLTRLDLTDLPTFEGYLHVIEVVA